MHARAPGKPMGLKVEMSAPPTPFPQKKSRYAVEHRSGFSVALFA
jgi:hypothetical protein